MTLEKLDDGRIRLAVGDDGSGLPEDFDVRKVRSMGLQLVCTLAEQLDAELVVRSGNGASFQLIFGGLENRRGRSPVRRRRRPRPTSGQASI